MKTGTAHQGYLKLLLASAVVVLVGWSAIQYLRYVVKEGLVAAPAVAATGCRTEERIADFAALLKTKPERAAVEDFIRKDKLYKNDVYDRHKHLAEMDVSISDTDCDGNYQHLQNVFDVKFSDGRVVNFTQSAITGGP